MLDPKKRGGRQVQGARGVCIEGACGVFGSVGPWLGKSERHKWVRPGLVRGGIGWEAPILDPKSRSLNSQKEMCAGEP